MKELSIEEKAKAYDEAIKRLEDIKTGKCQKTFVFTEGLFDYIFPELKESEDESMVKFIKNQLFNIKKTITENYELDAKLTKAICWIEKQCEQKIKTPEESLGTDSDTYNKIVDECIYGEQKPIDKVEPNFKVGDWVVTSYGKVNQVVSVDKYGDGYTLNDGWYFSGSWCYMYHLWTIQDAKDGDVLAWDDSKCIALFKNIYDEDSFNSYGFVGGCTRTFESRQSYHDIEGSHPATKEQRYLLFQKMHEAGYEWDAEKKELIKIEQKPAWSEEDEEIHRKCICAMRASACGFPEEEKFVEQVDNWLKSIKYRVQVQPQNKWISVNEEVYVKEPVLAQKKDKSDPFGGFVVCCDHTLTPNVYERYMILGNIVSQNTWKPSDEQIEALKQAKTDACGKPYFNALASLYINLKGY